MDQVKTGVGIWGIMPAFLQHHDWLQRAKESTEYDYQVEWNYSIKRIEKNWIYRRGTKKGLNYKR